MKNFHKRVDNECTILLYHGVTKEEIQGIENHNLKHIKEIDFIKQTFQKDNNIIASDFDSNYSYLMQHKAIMENDYKYLCKFDSGKDILRLIIAAEKSAYTENNNWIRNETNL